MRSWHAGGEGGAALLYDWERGVLECVFEAGTGDDMATRTELDPEDENQRRVGGAVSGPRLGEPLTVRRRCLLRDAGWRGFVYGCGHPHQARPRAGNQRHVGGTMARPPLSKTAQSALAACVGGLKV